MTSLKARLKKSRSRDIINKIVLSANDTIEVRIDSGRGGSEQEAEINFDGGLTQRLVTGDRVLVRRSEQTTKLIHISKVSFLETLHKKMSEN
mgnify:CR=1 FL=1